MVVRANSFSAFIKDTLKEAPIMRSGVFLTDMIRVLKNGHMDTAKSIANDFNEIEPFKNFIIKLQRKYKIRDPKNESDFQELYNAVKQY